jgi:glycogen operon protein
MNDEAWNADFVRSIGMLLNGSAIEEVDECGESVTGDTLLLLLNAHSDEVSFTLPPLDEIHQWGRVFDTFEPHGPERPFQSGGPYSLKGRSVALFKVTPPIRDRRRSAEHEDEFAEPVGAGA